MSNLGSMLTLEYGEAMPAEARSGHGFPVYGSNGEVGRHRKFLISEPGIIVGRKGSVGKVTWSDEPFWPIDTTYWVRCAPEDRRWIYWVLTWLPLARLDSSTGVPGLNRNDVYALTVSRPGSSEREKIAEILDTLDTAIHETEAIIAKLKAVKQGLLHDLLTRGIGANGELRPSQPDAPHLYKESPLGWIPKAWEAHVFGQTVEHVIDFRGRTPKKLGMDWGGGDVLALSANNVQPGAIDISREAYFGGDRLYRKWMTSGDVRKGDVLLTMEAPLGNVAQIPDDARYILSQRVIALRFNAGVVLNDFAFWQMQSNEFQQAMLRRSTGSTATGIQRAELVKLHFKVPPVQEQSLIAERLASIEHKLEGERLALAKQVQQKAGLMDDLLTGRVRVTPLLAETAQQNGSA
jgi:type I restriction enzyme S subunit